MLTNFVLHYIQIVERRNVTFQPSESTHPIVFQYPDEESVSPGTKLVSQKAFDFPAKAFRVTNDAYLLGNGSHPFTIQVEMNVVAYDSQEVLRPSFTGNGNMYVCAGPYVENTTVYYLTVNFSAEADVGRNGFSIECRIDEIDDFLTADITDHLN